MDYKIGSRGSKLAMIQTEYVRDRLREAYPEHTFEIVVIKTKGDKIQNRPLSQIGSKGLFVKEIEEKILSGEIQMGVHSMKDMPANGAEGLVFSKTWKREDPRDVLILREKKNLQELPLGAVIGTGSKRRAFQIKKLRPDLKIVDIRGNVETRIRKMQEQALDGIILAAAGLKRLGMEHKITQYLDSEEMISAPAQGALAIEVRKDNKELIHMLDAFADETSIAEIQAEREFLQRMGGGCFTPTGAVCKKSETGTYVMKAMYGDEEGKRIVFIDAEGKTPQETAQKAEIKIRRKIAGTVLLVGAGPGDPELITRKGFKALRKADCIIYDRLASLELLKEATDTCEKIYVGKANHHHTLKQEEINQLLVKKAMEHSLVVRLKGGDPYVFGRGGEEGLFLKEHGVEFSMVPGISSAIAGPAYAGIPVTHRGLSKGFHVVTAHSQEDCLADLDFNALARSKETCIFMMGLSKLYEITERLMKEGMSPATKAAVISSAAMKEQKTCSSDLAHIAQEAKKAQIQSPAVIVVGQVVSLRDALNVMEVKQKEKHRYLVIKIGKEISKLTEKLRNQGIFAEEVQVGKISIKPCAITKEDLKQTDWLVFTSQNGICGFFENLYAAGLDARNLAGIKLAVVGKKTAEALKSYGVHADLVPEDSNSAALAKVLLGELESTNQVMYPTGIQSGSELKKEIQKRCKLKILKVYENVPVEDELCEKNINEYQGVLFTCASSVQRFVNILNQEDALIWKQEGTAFSIGPKTSQKLQEIGVKHRIEAEHPDYDSMVNAVRKYCQRCL